MTDAALWIVIGVLLVALVYMQFRGLRALQAWGVQPSKAVIALRVANIVMAVGAVAFVFWMWVK